MSIAFPIANPIDTPAQMDSDSSQTLSGDSAAALHRLQKLMVEMEQVVVAFSGGVDSALVLDVAHEVLGDKALGLTAISATFPPEEQQIAVDFARLRGIRHLLIETHELEDEGYARNEGNRCYFCKTELFRLATDKARTLNIDWVLDGTIVDDLGDHRPGLQAASENDVRHPLVEAGFNKAMVREVAQLRGIHVWNKPSFACLGSRFAVGTRVTYDRIMQVQKVETALRNVGCIQFRARWHKIDDDAMVRIELGAEEMQLVLHPPVRQAITEAAMTVGFKWVTLDLMGYQKGNGSVRKTK